MLKRLDLPLLGSRNYVHGTDLYQAAVATIRQAHAEAAISDFTMNIRRICRTQVAVEIGDGTFSADPSSMVADFYCCAGEMPVFGRFSETDKTIVARESFDEAVIERSASIMGREITIRAPTYRERSIRVLVSACRILHDAVNPSAGYRWMFCHLHAPTPLAEHFTQALRLLQIGSPTRLSKCSFDIDGVQGGIDFVKVADEVAGGVSRS